MAGPVIVQVDFSDGMVRDVAPHLIPDTGCYDIVNGLLEPDGSVYRRGGSSYKSNTGFGSGLTFIWEGHFLAGRRTLFANSNDFGVLDVDDATPINLGGLGLPYPKGSAQVGGLLFIDGGHIYAGSRKSASDSTGTVETNGTAIVTGTGTSWNTTLDEGMIFGIGTERRYVVKTVDSDTQITLTEVYEGADGAGKSYLAEPLRTLVGSDPYPVSQVYASCQNRLITIDPADPERIIFSEIEKPHTSINQFETQNYHRMPEGARVLGAAAIGPRLMVFTTLGIWAVEGLAFDIVSDTGTPQHRVNVLSRDHILWAQAGIVGWQQALVVPCTEGVYLLDGTASPVLLSKNITPLWRMFTAGSNRIGGAAISEGHYFVPILAPDGTVRETLVCRLNREALDRRRKISFAWTRQTSLLSAYAERNDDVLPKPLLLGAGADSVSKVHDCTGFLHPRGSLKADPDGIVHSFELVTRDYQTGRGTKNMVKRLRPRYELLDAESDNPVILWAWGDGSYADGSPLWGQVEWDDFDWAAGGGGATFFPLASTPESPGRDGFKVRVNKFTRHIRFQMRTEFAAQSFTLRELGVHIRQSNAERR